MSDIDLAVKYSKQIESLLTQKFGAEGKGLHEKASYANSALPEEVLNQIRYIASVRNKVVHKDGYQIKDLRKFQDIAENVVTSLESMPEKIIKIPLEDRIKHFLGDFVESKQKPASIILAALTLIIVFYLYGLGASVFASYLAYILSSLLFTRGMIDILVSAIYYLGQLIILVLVVIFIREFWNFGKIAS